MNISLLISLMLSALMGAWTLPIDKTDHPEVKTDVFFKSFTVEDGLSNKTVNCFAEDKQGFIWICTLNGLSKFNGETFINFFNSEDNLSIRNDEINELLVIDIYLWIGTGDGLSRMDINTEIFMHFDLQDAEGYAQSL